MIIKKIVLILFIGTVSCFGFTQEVVSSAGETISNSEIEISWTIGEPIVETITGGSAILTQGMHQTKLTVTNVTELLYSGVEIKVFPNPTQDFVVIQFDEIIKGTAYSIFDINGKKIESANLSLNETNLDISKYMRGSYILKLYLEQNEPLQTFKIIKK